MGTILFSSTRGGPEGFPWLVLDAAGVPLLACVAEATAERVGFLLSTWKAGASGSGVRTVSREGATLPYGGREVARVETVPAALLRAAGDAPAASVPGPFPAPEPGPVVVPVAAEGDAWDGPEGCAVVPEVGGRFRVTFPRRPRLHVREALKVAGFRWDGALGSWTGYRLPVSFQPAARPAGGVA